MPQARWLIGLTLARALGYHKADRARLTANRRLRRDEDARLYHRRSRNRLSPRRFDQLP